ncbi:MAG: cell division protein FtsA [Firmicutes bacterium]|nr:cell division protein FtsA [Bacillota bacterium]
MRKIYTGIDIGSYGIKMVVSENVQGKFHVLAASNVRSKGIQKGLITDMDEACISLLKAKKNIEEMLGVSIDQAIVTVPSDGIDFNIVSGKIDLNLDEMIDSSEISKVLQEAVLGNIEDDRELITIVPISFHIDDKEGIKDPKGMMGKELSVKAVITTIPKYFLKQVITLLKQCNMDAVDVCFSAVGDYYEIRNKEMDKEVSAIINIGYDTTNVSIFNKGIMIKSEKIDMGSSIIEIDISKRYRLKRSVARYIKENFAVSNTRYADASDAIVLTTKTGESVTIGQLEISDLVEARVVELLKLAKKQINILTNREISYIIITGGISELAGFQYVVENIFDRRASTLNSDTMGVRTNIYSSALGITKYFHYKLELRGKSYSMMSESQANDLVSTSKKIAGTTNESIISKVFGYFSGD